MSLWRTISCVFFLTLCAQLYALWRSFQLDYTVSAFNYNERCFSFTKTHTYLSELVLLQIPLFDAVVSRAAEQHVSLHGQTLQAVVMWRLKVIGRTDVPHSSLCHVKHLGSEREEAGR